jgi:transcriptional regulator with XRE-family HTH domain
MKDPVLVAFGKCLKWHRKRREGLTQKKVAKLCGFHPDYLSLMEKGEINPPLTDLVKLQYKAGLYLDLVIPAEEEIEEAKEEC